MEARKSLLIVVNNSVGALFGLVGLYFIGQYLGPVAYGMVAFTLAIIGIGGAFVDLGLSQAHVKRVSEGAPLAACIATFGWTKLALGVVVTAGLVVGALTWDRWMGFHDSTTIPIVLVLSGYFLLLQVRSVPGMTFQALRSATLSQLNSLAETVARTLLVVAAALLFGAATGAAGRFAWATQWLDRTLALPSQWGTAQAGLLLACAYAGGMLVSAVVATSSFMRWGLPWGRFDKQLCRSYIRFAWPLALVSAVGVLAKHIDTVMIGYFWSARDVGHYFAALRVSEMLNIVPLAVGMVFFPLISELASRGNQETVRSVAFTTQRLLGLALLPGVVVLAVLAREILHLVGDGFLPAQPILVVLAVLVFVQGTGTVTSSLLKGMGNPRVIARVAILATSLNILLNFVLIPNSLLGVPLLGMRGTGAAIATVLSGIVSVLLLQREAYQANGVRLHGTFQLRQAAVAAMVGLAAWTFKQAYLGTSINRFWEVGAAAAALAAVHVLALAAVREFTRKDWLYFRDLFHARKMWTHILQELRARRP